MAKIGSSDPYTPIHNEVMEALMKINLSPAETRVMFAIWRKTYGFVDQKTNNRKKFDRITLSKISEMTGLLRPNISRALKMLKDKGVINRDNTSSTTGFSKKFMSNLGNVGNQARKISQPIYAFRQANIEQRGGDPEPMSELLKRRFL